MAQGKQKILKNAAKFTKKGQYEKAIAEYRKLTQDDYGDSSLNNIIGDLLIQNSRIQEAVMEYETAGTFYEEKGFVPKALAIYKKILRYDPTISRIYEKLAQLYSNQGLIQDAITQYEFLAKQYEHEGKTEDALDAYRQIADLDPSNLSIRERLSSLYAQQGFPEKACEERVKIGEKYKKRGDSVSAIKHFEMALKEMPNNEQALRGIVSVYLSEKRTDEAVLILNQILEKMPNNISALSTLGRVYMDTGQLDEAIEAFNKVYKLDPSQEGITEILGRIFILKGNYAEAFRCLKEIINVAIEREEFDRALAILNQLQQIEPKNIPIREKKIEIYQKLNRDEDTKSTFRELAEIYYEEGRIEEAYNIYERLFSMDPNNSQIKQRFNQISIELRGRPIDLGRLVAQPTFDSILEEPTVENRDLMQIGNDVLNLDDGSNTLESLFDTTEIEKISIPVFGDEEMEVGESIQDDSIEVEDIFSIAVEEETVRSPAAKAIEPSEDQIREFRIEAGVFMKYGLFEKAVERLKSVLVINPEDDETLEKLTEIYEKMGQNGPLVQTLVKRGDIASKNGNLEAAFKILKIAKDIAPNNEAVEKRIERLAKLEAKAAAISLGTEESESPDLIPADEDDFEPYPELEKQSDYDMEFPEGGDMAPMVDLSAVADASQEEQASLSNGLADVVREFREELVTRHDSRDAETHYNLGIAYREMGLLDEAIEEFKLTVDFPDYVGQAGDLLGLCYIDKEEFAKAISVLGRALKSGSISESERMTLMYDLAIAHKMEGEIEEAMELLIAIKEIKSDYRDISKKIKELERIAEE